MRGKRELKAVLGVYIIIVTVCMTPVYIDDDRAEHHERMTDARAAVSMIPTKTPTATPAPIKNKWVTYHNNCFMPFYVNNVEVSAIVMQFEYIGDYYITAYCPEECGYRVYSDGSDNYPTGWITSTGTIAHREAEWFEPSTCGINTSINHYGDLFLIDGKVFIAEDTGPGAVGRWIDTFQPDYESMMSFGSHWTDVYAVSYVQTEAHRGHFDINKIGGKDDGKL